MWFLVFIGMFLCPKFTLGCVLCHYDQQFLGGLIILIAIFEDKKTKTN